MKTIFSPQIGSIVRIKHTMKYIRIVNIAYIDGIPVMVSDDDAFYPLNRAAQPIPQSWAFLRPAFDDEMSFKDAFAVGFHRFFNSKRINSALTYAGIASVIYLLAVLVTALIAYYV
jgi:hypothetical protein